MINSLLNLLTNNPLIFMYAAVAASFLVFLAVYLQNWARFSSGFFFLCFMGACGMLLLALTAVYRFWLLDTLIIAIGLAFFFIAVFGVFTLVALLLLNARLVFKRERRSLGNSLTLLLALGIIALLVVSFALRRAETPAWLHAVWAGVLGVVAVHFFMLGTFLLSALLARFALPLRRVNYVVVLGSGLINGQVPPLLARRIDRAVRYWRRHSSNGRRGAHPAPKLVMSGGKGADEPRSEAEAMRDYAIAQGVPPFAILCEDKSTTTRENLRFSRLLMQQDNDGQPYRAAICTSSYHLLRAGMLARMEGLRVKALGGRTALYYLPNALLREYIAILSLRKKRHLVLAAIIFVLQCGAMLFFY